MPAISFSTYLQKIVKKKKSLNSTDQQAPPLNRKTISFSSVVCKRKVCLGSNDPDRSVLFETTPKNMCGFVFFLQREEEKHCMANKKERDTKSVCRCLRVSL